MTRARSSSRLGLLTLSGLLALATLGAATVPHFDLEKSSPEADAMVHEIEAVTLWFTEEPAEESVTVRLIDGSGEVVEGLSAAVDEEDATRYVMPTTDGLAAGTYTVSWRGMGGDGHVVRGEFNFTVMQH
ncbi:copper resistance CopC family protein [Gaopeijia maritima]|uniref:Copper resistance CopC family protein n=1 Tax=Gaopeijia maritima TaxID=3119007 RepID=A0ABU9E4L0_9BACT